MLKGNLLKVIGETSKGIELTRLQKFEVFCNVCDNMLKEGRISKVQHERWTEIFWPVEGVAHCRFPSAQSTL